MQYDVLVVDENLKPLRSIAQEEGRQFLFSPSGQSQVDLTIKEEPGTAHYVIWIYGLAPEGVVPSTPTDYLQLNIPILAPEGDISDIISTPTTVPDVKPTAEIPSWIKNNAAWWADGSIDDTSFVQGIQYLIKEGIMKISS